MPFKEKGTRRLPFKITVKKELSMTRKYHNHKMQPRVRRLLLKRWKIGYQGQLLLNAGQNDCRMRILQYV